MVYALIALGYTMVYGVIQLINFAHGEVFMVGAYLSLTVITLTFFIWPGAPFGVVLVLMIVCAMFCAALLGAAIERFAYKPLRGSPQLTTLITSIGVSFFLQNAVMLLYGSKEQSLPEIIPNIQFHCYQVSFSLIQLVIFATSIGLMLFLTWFVKNTKLGKAMRASAENPEAAQLVGISVNRIIRVTFMMGSSLAAVGGALFGMYYGSINFHDGYLAGLKAFTAAVFGGIGSIPGAMVGGALLGIFEGLGAGYISSEWKDVFAFILLGIVLICKPSGLFGENLPDKV
ncbi:MAG: branched-chain amino acid ABC transporter permease [Candidatus Omnitrophica bacterium CG1_02_46_14]|nr:MAG: branched-chain amino acid ABC transporter permease [Candidatus Omnitrophica bacterium CG1_02_46_14]